MSFSFTVRARNKTAAKIAIQAELAKIVTMQPVHAADEESARIAAFSMIDQLADEHDRDVAVSVHGSISIALPDNAVQSVSVGASAHLTPRKDRARFTTNH